MTVATWGLFLVAVFSAWHAARSAKSAREDAERTHKLHAEHLEFLRKDDARKDAAERQRLLKAKKADMKAIFRSGPTTLRWLNVKNHGMAPACEVKVRLDGAPLMEHVNFAHHRHEQPEQTVFAAEEEVSYKFFPRGQIGPHVRVSISWEDDSGEPGEWEGTLRVP